VNSGAHTAALSAEIQRENDASRSRRAEEAPDSPRNALGSVQRAAGNQAMGELLRESPGPVVTLPGRGQTHPVAESMKEPGVRFRVPEFSKLQSTYTDKDLKIPEVVIKARVTQLLERMAREKRLKSKDPVPMIVAKIFPSPGTMDEAEFNKAIDPSDRSEIYKSVTDADTKVKDADKPKLKSAMKEASDLITKVQGNDAGLKQVFGAQDATAKANYGNAKAALDGVAAHMDAHVTTDYNLDDPEVGLGGWASFDSQRMHLLLKVAQVDDLNETKATVIHESAHLSNKTVDDQVYYASPGFFEADEAKKVANAAHYEELPRREMGISKFDKKTFTPGVTATGAKMTREDTVRAAVNLYLRKAWDAGVDAHSLVRGVRREYLAGNNKPFNDNKPLLFEVSKLMDLTIHEQAPGKAVVTTLDVTLSESVSRGVSLVGSLASKVAFPASPGSLSDDQLRDQMVADAVVKYGKLLNDATRDKKLLDWLVDHYRKLPSV
jgi:hypothetical protein